MRLAGATHSLERTGEILPPLRFGDLLISWSTINTLNSKEFPMGKGDRKTRRGKTYRGSYGNNRSHTVAAPAVAGKSAVVTKPAAVKKAAPARKKSA